MAVHRNLGEVATYLIYVLSDPRTGEVRYVGKTESLTRARYNHHMHRARKGARHHVYCWLRKLLSEGVQPLMEVVEECNSHEELAETERFYIAYFRSLGLSLTNHTDGGEGCVGFKHTDEARKRMSEMKRGKKLNRKYEHKLTEEQVDQIASRYKLGLSATALAADFGVANLTVMRALRRVGAPTRNAGQQRWTSTRMK